MSTPDASVDSVAILAAARKRADASVERGLAARVWPGVDLVRRS